MSALRSVLLATLILSPLPARAAGNPADGFEVFEKECGECHSVRPNRHKKGPSLFGVVGRPAATASGFANYSDALKQSGISWSAEKLDGYVTEPKRLVAGGKMLYDGLPNAKAREDLIAYLMDQK